MSQWTHVAAVLRIDDFRFNGLGKLPDLGVPVEYGDPEEKFDQSKVPCGSEGSLKHHLWVDPNESSLAAYTVTIWGDLRDYVDTDAIVHYLKGLLKDRMVRSAVARIDVEGRPSLLFHWDDDKNDLILVATL